MPSEEQMSVDERRKYLKLVAPRYANAGRGERSRLLTEMSAVTGLHRKSLLRLLHGPTLERTPRKPRLRRRRYGAAVAATLPAGSAQATPAQAPATQPTAAPGAYGTPLLDYPDAGQFETDLVLHCGPVTAGEYIHTLQLVDIATGWSPFSSLTSIPTTEASSSITTCCATSVRRSLG